MSWKGDLLKAGILSNGDDLNLIRGRLQYANYDVSRDMEPVTEVALTAGAKTLTAAQLVDSRIFKQTPSAATTNTTDTAANIIAALGDYTTGTHVNFTVVNLASATYVITIAGGSSVTLVGLATIAPATSATFKLVVASSTTMKLYRL